MTAFSNILLRFIIGGAFMRNEILDYFRKANGEFVSGEQISKDLHVSRTAIWKHIKVLKERGYIFESSTRKGYRLIYAPNLLTPLEIDSALHTETFGRHVVYMSSTRSTNEEAKKIAREGAEEGTIVVAEEQTGGHGRLTRGFYSPFAKGIWFSLILRPKFFPMEASKCTLLAAIGVCRGIRRLGLKDAGIKKGFIIMVVNDQKISSPEQLEKIVDKVLKGNEDDRYIVVKGFYPNGRTKVYAIDLAE